MFKTQTPQKQQRQTMFQLAPRRKQHSVYDCIDEESGGRGLLRPAPPSRLNRLGCSPCVALCSWFALIVVTVLALTVARAIERRMQFSTRIQEAQLSGALLPDGARLVVCPTNFPVFNSFHSSLNHHFEFLMITLQTA